MAVQDSPNSVDITDIQFKLHSKYQLFDVNASTPNYNGIDLLATASTLGLIICGKPSTTEIQVLRLKDAVENAETSIVSVRSINLPGEPYLLALSCDHKMLAVCYMINRQSFMDIFAVQTFLSANVMCVLSKVAVSNGDGVKVKQILWNPVISNVMAICLYDGTLGAYTIKPNSFEYNSLDKSENARCACWSPKGKQIVVAFPNGKLAQYKPDLKLAKTIPCAVQLFGSIPFSPVAIQWLSTYQFAVVFVEEKEDSAQSLFIINAPKSAPPTYINYYDITYSQTGPRSPQVFLIHILQWNLLLMASSNGTEIGLLGTTESGETPTWKQYIFDGDGRAELPLTADKEDTFFIGLSLETGCTHQLTIGENQIPVMPMLHILSTHGVLLSFNLLNFQPSRVDICSPPQIVSDQSGLNMFRPIAIEARAAAAASVNTAQPQQQPLQQQQPTMGQQQSFGNTTKLFPSPEFQQSSNLTFSIPATAATSTPAKPPIVQPTIPKPTFPLSNAGAQPSKPAMTNLFGAPAQPPAFGSLNTSGKSLMNSGSSLFNLSASKEPTKPFAAATATVAPAPAPIVQSNTANKTSSETSQPFLTVQPNYKPSTQPAKNASSGFASNSENDAILRKLIKEEIDTFDTEFRSALNRSRNIQISICGKDELSKLIKSIDEMQEITVEATESTESIKADVQSLRLTLYEMLAMQAEAQSKVDEYTKMSKTTEESLAINQTHRRLVNKLQNLLAQNQSRYDVFSKQLDANWNAHLQNKRENDKARMRIPTLENVYQTLEKQHQILMKEKEKINKLKLKGNLNGLRDSSPNKIKYSYSNTDNLKMNSLVDSVLSLTIGDQIKNERQPLNARKIDALRKVTLGSRTVNFIKPMRPEPKGINSEFIIEKKLASAKAQKEKENLKKAEAELERAKQEKLKQDELAKQKELAKSTKSTVQPQLQPAYPQQTQMKLPASSAVPLSAQPTQFSTPRMQQVVSNTAALTPSLGEKQKPVTASQQSPIGGLLAPSSSSSSSPLSSSSAIGTVPSKPMFGATSLEKQFSFAAAKVEKQPNDSVSSISANKSAPFNTPPQAAAASPFSFATKTDAPNMFGSSTTTSASLFSFGGGAQKPLFSMTTTPQANAPENMPKPTAKIPLLLTPTIDNKTPTLNPLNPAAVNTAPKPTIPTVVKNTPVSTPALPLGSVVNAQQQSINVQKPPPAQEPIAATAATAFKFELGNSSNVAQSKSDDKENSAPSVVAPSISKTNSLDTFSFALGSSITSQPSSENALTKSIASASAATAPTSALTNILLSTQTPLTPASVPPAVTSSTPSSSIGFSFAKASAESSIFGGTSNAASTNITSTTASNATASSTADPSNIFQGFNICKPNVADNSNTAKGLFGSSSFGNFGSNVSSPTNTAAASIFGGANTAQSTAVSTNLFGSKPATTTANTIPTTSTAASIFGASSINTSLSSPAPTNNLFGGSSTASVTSPVQNNIFGGGAAQSPTTPAQNNSFGASPFGANATSTTTNLFGSAAAATSPQQSASIFGGSAVSSPTTGGSMFGGTASFGSPSPQQPQFGSSTFGGGSTAFGSQAASPFGGSLFGGGSTFGQTAQSPTQSIGFGSPQQQPSGFGLSAIAASANPTFGSGATFGSSATFGSPKGFGTFASMNNANPSFTSPQKNTLFESLGASENTMTFGNLAQNQASPPPPAQKPFGGGSSFSSWR